ncbi:hypothetical protein FHS90_001178 [Rufibacter quisquiliarum]|uniref:Uncharacterized protein n=1 Tax=Rufibacter quisquiliarum TaxID=1549639 RepID=A0A839GAC4_9BACT|nr:hypothetical protein [Rufibacter quisquiliarum]
MHLLFSYYFLTKKMPVELRMNGTALYKRFGAVLEKTAPKQKVPI